MTECRRTYRDPSPELWLGFQECFLALPSAPRLNMIMIMMIVIKMIKMVMWVDRVVMMLKS